MQWVDLDLDPQPTTPATKNWKWIISLNFKRFIKIFQFINQGHKKINGRTRKDKTQTGKILTCEKYLV